MSHFNLKQQTTCISFNMIHSIRPNNSQHIDSYEHNNLFIIKTTELQLPTYKSVNNFIQLKHVQFINIQQLVITTT